MATVWVVQYANSDTEILGVFTTRECAFDWADAHDKTRPEYDRGYLQVNEFLLDPPSAELILSTPK